MTFRRLTFAALFLSVQAVPAVAQTPREQIVAGYELLHRGDAAAASGHFEALLKASPNDLALRFGWLMAENDRIDFDTRRVPAF